MKIQGRKSQALGSLGPVSAPVPQEQTAASEAPGGSDSVSLSNTGELRRLNEAVNALPTIRAEKVEGLRDAIEEGSYHVETEKLARKVVDEALRDAITQQLRERKA